MLVSFFQPKICFAPCKTLQSTTTSKIVELAPLHIQCESKFIWLNVLTSLSYRYLCLHVHNTYNKLNTFTCTGLNVRNLFNVQIWIQSLAPKCVTTTVILLSAFVCTSPLCAILHMYIHSLSFLLFIKGRTSLGILRHCWDVRFFFVQHTKEGKINQITSKYTKWRNYIPNCRKLYQMSVKFTKNLYSKMF
jgi:hypothetical protein